jgi:hypothetical protein
MHNKPARLSAAARRAFLALMAGAGLVAATSGPAVAGINFANHSEPFTQAH